MSRNSKSKRKKQARKQYTAIRKGGGKGPSRTTRVNQKDPRKVWWNPENIKARKIKKDKHSATQEDGAEQKKNSNK